MVQSGIAAGQLQHNCEKKCLSATPSLSHYSCFFLSSFSHVSSSAVESAGQITAKPNICDLWKNNPWWPWQREPDSDAPESIDTAPLGTEAFPLSPSPPHRKSQTHCFNLLSANGGNCQRSESRGAREGDRPRELCDTFNTIKNLLMRSPALVGWWSSGKHRIKLAARVGWRVRDPHPLRMTGSNSDEPACGSGRRPGGSLMRIKAAAPALLVKAAKANLTEVHETGKEQKLDVHEKKGK